MAGVAWEAVKARLVEALPAVVGSTVASYNGPVVTGQKPTAYLTIGAAPSRANDEAGSFEQVVGPDGFDVEETGTVLCELGAVTGSTTIPSVFASFAAVAAWVQADMTLGGTLGKGSTCTVSADVAQAQTGSGAVQRLVLSFNYFTRL